MAQPRARSFYYRNSDRLRVRASGEGELFGSVGCKVSEMVGAVQT
jgi:hypothetical protein